MKRPLWLIVLGCLLAGHAAAQEDSRLIAAVRLAQDGMGDSARAIVARLRQDTAPTDSLYPQILYTSGLVARSAGDRAQFFRRVAVEYASSSWADDAWLGLAQDDFAAGNAANAARTLERLRADYPLSPLLPVAAYWGARANFELGRTAEACRWLADGLSLAGENVELRNQLAFYSPRCARITADSARGDSAAAPSGPFYSVQVAAVGSEAAAQSAVASLRQAGYQPRLVREGGFVKIRVGRYPDRDQASAAARDIRTRLGGSPFVVEEK
ncbi:MAG: SPOR domain-containing protein [Gemmatimonadales bacterium]